VVISEGKLFLSYFKSNVGLTLFAKLLWQLTQLLGNIPCKMPSWVHTRHTAGYGKAWIWAGLDIWLWYSLYTSALSGDPQLILHLQDVFHFCHVVVLRAIIPTFLARFAPLSSQVNWDPVNSLVSLGVLYVLFLVSWPEDRLQAELKYKSPQPGGPTVACPQGSPPPGRSGMTGNEWAPATYKSHGTLQNTHTHTHTQKYTNACLQAGKHSPSPSDPEAVSVMWLWECRWDLCFSDCNNRDQIGTCGQNSKPGAEHSGACLSPFWCCCFSW